MVHLSDPELPDDDLDQLVFKLLEAAGLTIVVAGPWDLADTVAEVSRVSSFFAESVALQNGLAAHPAHKSLWAGLDGPDGSAVMLFGLPGDGRILARVTGDLQNVDARWRRGGATRGDIDLAVAQFLEGANAVPIWELYGNAEEG